MMRAVVQMSKLEIAALQAAYAGGRRGRNRGFAPRNPISLGATIPSSNASIGDDIAAEECEKQTNYRRWERTPWTRQ
jgi:hypothetical protein